MLMVTNQLCRPPAALLHVVQCAALCTLLWAVLQLDNLYLWLHRAPAGEATIIFEAVTMVGNTLFIVFLDLNEASRMVASLDLETGIIKSNFMLVSTC
jgi:hypothetical protein